MREPAAPPRPTGRYLLASHDAGGTVPPMLALAEALIGRGHEVTWLGQPSIARRATRVGCRFVAWSKVPDYDAGKPIEEQFEIALPVITGAAVGEQMVSVFDEHRSELVVVDANLAGVAAAAEARALPSAVLLHSMYKTFVDTWFADLWPFMGPVVNETRAGFGLHACDSWARLFAAHDRLISVVPRELDAPVAEVPANLRHFGFLVPEQPLGTNGPGFARGESPAILVALSTTYQDQEPLLRTIVEALGSLDVRGLVTAPRHIEAASVASPTNVVVADFVDHRAALAETDVMITHGGLGTVAAALSQGVPLVCTPIARDQPLNAERVAALGAGVTIGADSSAAVIIAAVERVLSDAAYRDSARAVREQSAAAGGAAAVRGSSSRSSRRDGRECSPYTRVPNIENYSQLPPLPGRSRVLGPEPRASLQNLDRTRLEPCRPGRDNAWRTTAPNPSFDSRPATPQGGS